MAAAFDDTRCRGEVSEGFRAIDWPLDKVSFNAAAFEGARAKVAFSGSWLCSMANSCNHPYIKIVCVYSLLLLLQQEKLCSQCQFRFGHAAEMWRLLVRWRGMI